jgi:tripartite-type tricarboxylate transporter receptor subunit TctC
MIHVNPHQLARTVLAWTLIAVSCVAQAQVTAKSLRIIIPFPPGGTQDTVARLIADKIRPQFPGGVLIDNKPGAAGNIGVSEAFRAKPDGSTLLISSQPPLVANPFLLKTDFDTKDLTPITVLVKVPNVVIVNPQKLPVRNVAELINLLKANPGKYNYASQSIGSTSHLTAVLFEELSGTKMAHIPYKGTSPAMADLLGGQVDLSFDNLSSSAKYHQSGKLRILAVADAERSPVIPEVPTFAESGVPGMDKMLADVWYAATMPPNTPPAIADAMNKMIVDALNQPDVQQRLKELGVTHLGWSREKTGAFILEELSRWGPVIKKNNITMHES